MFNLFKNRQVIETQAAKINYLEKELKDTREHVDRLTNKYLASSKRCAALNDHLAEVLTEVDNLGIKNNNLSERLDALHNRPSDVYDDIVATTNLEMQNYKDSIKSEKLNNFIDQVINSQFIDKNTNDKEPLIKIHYYINCIKDFTQYLSNNNLSVRKK